MADNSDTSPMHPGHEETGTTVVSGRSARRAARQFNLGNIIAITLPIPLGLLWVGISMVVYAMHRHHPNPKVGHYTQHAAYRFYGISGFFVAAATFIPGDAVTYYLIAWIAAMAILIPWSIWDLAKIQKDTWEDMHVPCEEPV